MELNDLKQVLLNAHIQWIKRTCNLIMLDLDSTQQNNHVNIHIECLLKILKDDAVIASTNDIYYPGRNVKHKKFRWDRPNMSLFDDCIIDNQNLILFQKVVDVMFINKELKMFLENGVIIEFIPDTVKDLEAYRIFNKEKDYLII